MSSGSFLHVADVVEVSAVGAPTAFTFHRDEWPEWIAHFERFRRASRLDASEPRVQIAALLQHMGPASGRLLEEVPAAAAAAADAYEPFVDAVDAHFRRRPNVVLERARFNQRQQRDAESAESYIAAVGRLARACHFGAMEAELVRDRLVVGIRDRKCSEALQLEEHLTLDEAKSIIVHAETVARVAQAKGARAPRDPSAGRSAAATSSAKTASNGSAATPSKDQQQQPQPARARTPAPKDESFEFI